MLCSFLCSLYCTLNHYYFSYNFTYQQPNIIPFPCLYRMFFYVFIVFYTHIPVLMLQYHISTTKHYSVPMFIWYVISCVPCIVHTIASIKVTISHIIIQTIYRSLVYTICSFMCSLYLTHTFTCPNVTI